MKQLRVVEEEITGYAEQALEETERLKQENEDLRKAAEDAALDRCALLSPEHGCTACIGSTKLTLIKVRHHISRLRGVGDGDVGVIITGDGYAPLPLGMRRMHEVDTYSSEKLQS